MVSENISLLRRYYYESMLNKTVTTKRVATEKNNQEKMGLNATWCMAVGGMVGGGIFSVLGVVISIAGQWAWLSFILAGLIALATGHSYAQLSEKFGKGGGAFSFLGEINRKGFAGSLSWVLIFGYALTISVYAFTFGHYVANVIAPETWVPRICALAIIGVLIAVNLRGVGDTATFEIYATWGKLIILLGLAAIGLFMWQPEQLTQGLKSQSIAAALVGGASVFMAYEGFQLISYDFNDIKDPERTLPKATLLAVSAVILIYVLVALGATMLVGAETVIREKEIALAVAGREALGIPGLILVTLGAAFSTGSAINATLFATARLAEEVAADGELPKRFAHENKNEIPDYAIMSLGGAGAMLAMIGSLSTLVEAASLVFLFTFTTVNILAWQQDVRRRWIALLGAFGAAAGFIGLAVRLTTTAPYALIAIAGAVAVAAGGRSFILRHTETEG